MKGELNVTKSEKIIKEIIKEEIITDRLRQLRERIHLFFVFF